MAKSYRGKNSNRRRSSGKYKDTRKEDVRPCDREKSDTSSLNDISWYSRNPNLLAAAGSFPYPYRPGMTMNLEPTLGSSRTAGTFTKVQSMVRLDWAPSFGESKMSTDPASIAAKEFYGRVRESFSGSIDADAPDFLVYIGALDSIFTYIGWLKRIYRAISTYTPENMDMPECILRASGFTADEDILNLRQNKIRLWQMINELILMSHKFKCPAVMDLFNRHYWMSDNVYADQASLRAQLYMYNLVGVYKCKELPIDGDATNKAMGLQMTPIPTRRASSSTPVTVDSLYNFGLGLIQALDAWDDGYLISGYLQRAFQDVPSFTVSELLQNELISAAYVPEVLTQIENFHVITPPGVESSDAMLVDMLNQMTVTQRVTDNSVVTNDGVIVTPTEKGLAQFNYWAGLFDRGHMAVLNAHSDLPTVADTVIASRMTAFTEWTVVQTSKILCSYSCGTEVPLGFANYGMGINTYNYPMKSWEVLDFTEQMTYEDQWNVPALCAIQQFDWHPIIMVLMNLPTGTAMYPAGDMYNPTVVSPEQLRNLHKICLYSELNSFGIM